MKTDSEFLNTIKEQSETIRNLQLTITNQYKTIESCQTTIRILQDRLIEYRKAKEIVNKTLSSLQ